MAKGTSTAVTRVDLIRSPSRVVVMLALAATVLGPSVAKVAEPAPLAPEVAARQEAEYQERRAKGVLALQRFRQSAEVPVRGPAGCEGVATLTSLNPRIDDWYILELSWSDGSRRDLHLVNPLPHQQSLRLDPDFPSGLVIAGPEGEQHCELWSQAATDCLPAIDAARAPYVSLCGGALYARVPTRGSRTTAEWAAELVRDHLWGGEKITVMVRDAVLSDTFLDRASDASPEAAPQAAAPADAPPAARVAPERSAAPIAPRELGIEVAAPGGILPGHWYAASGRPGVYLSFIAPGFVASDILAGHRDHVPDLDSVERDALVYLVAFDLSRHELAFSLGTDHPRVSWSERVSDALRDASLPGPDGIGAVEPLVATGLVPPQLVARTVATFTGGFKRRHGAFSRGELGRVNGGSHYGFIEGGAVLSKLQPGLSTVYVLDDGRVEMKTWTADDDLLVERIRYARQNGVPLVERDPRSGAIVPGALVGRWGEGNWSGSEDGKLRALRAGIALLASGERRWLVYGWFSGATPSGMARVFEAYGVEHAMHLDMNALEHTYLAIYRAGGGKLEVQHLARGMSVLDKTAGGTVVPRFLGYADNRDFFYLLARPGSDAPTLGGVRVGSTPLEAPACRASRGAP